MDSGVAVQLLSYDGTAIGFDQGDNMPNGSGLDSVMISKLCETNEERLRFRRISAGGRASSGPSASGTSCAASTYNFTWLRFTTLVRDPSSLRPPNSGPHPPSVGIHTGRVSRFENVDIGVGHPLSVFHFLGPRHIGLTAFPYYFFCSQCRSVWWL